MSTPVVVQGTHVTQQQAFGSALDSNNNDTASAPVATGDRSDKVESGCNDPIFAILFYGAFFGIIATAALYGPDALDKGKYSEYEYDGFLIVTIIIVIVSLFGAGIGMGLLFWIPTFLIKTALIFMVVMSGLLAVFSFLGGLIFWGVVFLILFAITVCYAFCAWFSIPFATVNLVTACTAIKANLGVAVYAYLFAIFAGAWSIVWLVAVAGVFDHTSNCDNVNETCSNPNYGLIFILVLALYFGQQVIQNSIHVTVAGTVGTWWYAPEESGCCSSSINNSFIRTMTTSFGSICFGSLLVAIFRALRALVKSSGERGLRAAIASCILACLASIIEYFNKWAFVYVGLYGMSYLKAGKGVFELFSNRGWEAIISDDLVGITLFLISIIVGGVMGCLALLIESTSDLFEESGGDSKLIAFLLGFVVGLVITSILMSTIASAVNAIIVLFAEGPNEFEVNHPELSNKMRQVWSEFYPEISV